MLSEKAGMNVVYHSLGNLTFIHSIYLHRSSIISREACSDIFLIFPYLLLFIEFQSWWEGTNQIKISVLKMKVQALKNEIMITSCSFFLLSLPFFLSPFIYFFFSVFLFFETTCFSDTQVDTCLLSSQVQLAYMGIKRTLPPTLLRYNWQTKL